MKKYKQLIIYYFTGTGNALKAGRWICKEAEKKNITARLCPIDNNYSANPDEIDSKTLIGFLSPTHGFNIAPAMLQYIMKFPAGKNADVFVLNTRAGLKFFKYFLPGISGAAQFLPMIILKLKGHNIMGGLPLDMPSNWLFVHPGLGPKSVKSIVNKCKGDTVKFARNIFGGKKVFRKIMITLPIDIALLPISFIYYFYARFIFAKTMIHSNDCNSCGICVSKCPVNAIKIIDNRPYWTYSCESCMRCVNICPGKSVQTSHLIFLIILVVPGIIFNNFLFEYIQLPKYIDFDYTISILRMAISLVELFILYAVIQRLLKFRLVGFFFKYTSLSAYWRRYRAPGISVKDFRRGKAN